MWRKNASDACKPALDAYTLVLSRAVDSGPADACDRASLSSEQQQAAKSASHATAYQ